jgi:hypothetical protein
MNYYVHQSVSQVLSVDKGSKHYRQIGYEPGNRIPNAGKSKKSQPDTYPIEERYSAQTPNSLIFNFVKKITPKKL